MKNRLLTVAACLALLLPAAASPALPAAVDVDFGMHVDIGDDADLFLEISSRYFGRDRATVADLGVRYADPDDFSVSLFLSARSGWDAARIDRLRRQGMTWWQIGLRIGVPIDAYFVPVARTPGPPYGKAYGYWKKHGRGKHAGDAFTDHDIRNLVAVRMLHEYYGVPVEVAMEWRASGADVRTILAREYRHRHAKTATGHPGKGKARGHGGKGKGKKK